VYGTQTRNVHKISATANKMANLKNIAIFYIAVLTYDLQKVR